jgi:hypothetical protein
MNHRNRNHATSADSHDNMPTAPPATAKAEAGSTNAEKTATTSTS